MRHHRSTGAGIDEGKLHTFVMDYYCFPSQGSQLGITVLVIKEAKTKAISTFMVPNKGVNGYLVKAVVDFTSGSGCGRAILKSGGELAIVALQEAVKNSRQSDTILENSQEGDSQSNGAAENVVREAEGMIRTWKMSVEEKLKAVIEKKHVLLPWVVVHAGVMITRYKTVHGGKTAHQRIKNERPSNKMLSFAEKSRLDDAEGQSQTEGTNCVRSIHRSQVPSSLRRRLDGCKTSTTLTHRTVPREERRSFLLTEN